MKNDFKKGFFAGAGGILGVLTVLSIPVGIYLIYSLIKLLYVPTTNLLLRKGEYLDYRNCLKKTHLERNSQLLKKYGLLYSSNVGAIVQLQKEYCGERPKEWKWE